MLMADMGELPDGLRESTCLDTKLLSKFNSRSCESFIEIKFFLRLLTRDSSGNSYPETIILMLVLVFLPSKIIHFSMCLFLFVPSNQVLTTSCLNQVMTF